MREIKFRAWDPESDDNGYMVYSDGRDKKNWPCGYGFWFDNENKLVCRWYEDYDDSFGCTQENSGSLADIMQFTGLCDKKGKEIYERDVLDVKLYDWSRADSVIARQNVVIEFRDGCFGFEWGFRKEFTRIKDFSLATFEVIGNVHENPDLLEQQPCG